MQQSYYQEETYDGTERREDKIMAAKMAFGTASGSYLSYPSKISDTTRTGGQQGERKHRYGIWRFVAAVMLFFAFLAGTHFDVSFGGWNQERLEKMMADDTRWRQVVHEVSSVMKNIPGASEK